MSAQPHYRYTPEEYLALERIATEKHEYFDGKIFQMSGASYAHNVVRANLVATLRPSLRKQNCDAVSNDLRVHIPATGLYTYPDVVVLCGQAQFLDNTLDTLLNPVALIEVLSPTTEQYDRTTKFDHYRSIPSLREYILVSLANPRVECFRRNQDNTVPPENMIWSYRAATSIEDSAKLELLQIALPLREVYERIDFTDEDW
jgi:Uma2 family endonuclease